MSTVTLPRPHKRCFVSGNNPNVVARLAEMVRAHGIEAATVDEVRGGHSITKELIRLISEADCIAVAVEGTPQGATAYELGLAQGLGKPSFVVFAGSPSMSLANTYVAAVQDAEHLQDAAADIVRFLRNANFPTRSKPETARSKIESLNWARAALRELRSLERPSRYEQFEKLCGQIFCAAGAEVAEVGRDSDMGADLIVWLNEIAFELGGPTLVECKLYGGGVGSVIKNSEATVRRLEAVMDRSEARLALLVYDHDRAGPPPSLYETPRVLAIAIEDLITAVEHTELERTILKRRERALYSSRPQ